MSHQVVNASGSIAPLIKGVSGKKIRVLSAFLVENNSTGTWEFESSTGPTRLTGNLFISSGPIGAPTATGALVLPHNPEGWFQTLESDDLNLTNVGGGGVGLGGVITYDLV